MLAQCAQKQRWQQWGVARCGASEQVAVQKAAEHEHERVQAAEPACSSVQ